MTRDIGPRLLDLLRRRQGQVVGYPEIERTLWPNHPPADPRANLKVWRCTLNRRLASEGLTIKTVRDVGMYMVTR